MRLEGKSAIITGAARGIGKAFAERYVREGATVAIADITLEGAEATAAEIGPKCLRGSSRCDRPGFNRPGRCPLSKQRTGGPDILINNAALFDLAPIAEITRESYERYSSTSTWQDHCSRCRRPPDR